ncbi:hypothetical protein [Methylomonas albis]|nr:hypothetical protein [Methylomonas albis]
MNVPEPSNFPWTERRRSQPFASATLSERHSWHCQWILTFSKIT